MFEMKEVYIGLNIAVWTKQNKEGVGLRAAL
jgi:hypothetical protein